MASTLTTAYITANAQANALNALANGGLLKFYTGAQPATPETAVGAQTLLATATLNATAFGAAVNGVITANAIATTTIVATGTVTWFRQCKADGTALWDGSVGTAGCDINVATTSWVANATLSVGSYTYTVPAV